MESKKDPEEYVPSFPPQNIRRRLKPLYLFSIAFCTFLHPYLFRRILQRTALSRSANSWI
jgi:hypothetical protein